MECKDYSLEDELLIKQDIKENLETLLKKYRLHNSELNTFYDNCFRIYDYARNYAPEKRGMILMYIVHQASEMQIEAFEKASETYYKEGYKREDIDYSIGKLEENVCKGYARYLFKGHDKRKENPKDDRR